MNIYLYKLLFKMNKIIIITDRKQYCQNLLRPVYYFEEEEKDDFYLYIYMMKQEVKYIV